MRLLILTVVGQKAVSPLCFWVQEEARSGPDNSSHSYRPSLPPLTVCTLHFVEATRHENGELSSPRSRILFSLFSCRPSSHSRKKRFVQLVFNPAGSHPCLVCFREQRWAQTSGWVSCNPIRAKSSEPLAPTHPANRTAQGSHGFTGKVTTETMRVEAVSQPLRTFVCRDKCVTYLIHKCLLRSSFIDLRRCSSRSLCEFGFERFKISRLTNSQFTHILHSL